MEIDEDKINSQEIKSHIKNHYSASGSWREEFKSTKDDSWKSKCINYLKRDQFKKIISHFEDLDGKVILDAGCGNGEFSLALAKRFPQAKIYAIDFSKSMCDLTRKRVENLGLDNIEVTEGDVENLNFEDVTFDVVLCVDLLHHIPNKTISKSLGELFRVLKVGGDLVIDFKNKHNLLLYYQHKKNNRVTYFRTNRSFKEMNSFLKNLNLKVDKVKGSIGPSIIAPYVTLFLKK